MIDAIFCFLILAQPNQFKFSYPKTKEWRSTGLYAKAGTVVTLTFPEAAIGKLEVVFQNPKLFSESLRPKIC